MTTPLDAEATAREFAELLLDRSFDAATELVAERDDDAAPVVDAFPDAFSEPSTTAADALEAYWWGLYGQYGPPTASTTVDDAGGVGDDDPVERVAVEFAFNDGSETATLELAADGVAGFAFDPAYEVPSCVDADAVVERETIRRIDAGEFDDDETIWGRPGVWHRSLNGYDPTAAASDLAAPIFVATRFSADEATQPHLADFQRKRFHGWDSADLPAGSEVTCYDGLDHYLQDGYAPRTPLSVDFGGNVSADVLADVGAWLHATADR